MWDSKPYQTWLQISRRTVNTIILPTYITPCSATASLLNPSRVPKNHGFERGFTNYGAYTRAAVVLLCLVRPCISADVTYHGNHTDLRELPYGSSDTQIQQVEWYCGYASMYHRGILRLLCRVYSGPLRTKENEAWKQETFIVLYTPSP